MFLPSREQGDSVFQAVVGGSLLVNEIFTTFKTESYPYLEKTVYL